MPPATSFEDIDKLGCTKQEVFKRCNEQRDRTMKDETGLHLNDGLAANWGAFCYNVLLADAAKVPGSNTTTSDEETTVVITYDHSAIPWPVTREFEDRRTVGIGASLSIETSAVIPLESTITVTSVADSGLTLQIDTESTSVISKTNEESVTFKFNIVINPFETVKVLRTKIVDRETASYNVPYGLNKDGRILTEGREYQNYALRTHPLTPLLKLPIKNIGLIGNATYTRYFYKLVRSDDCGQKTISMATDLASSKSKLFDSGLCH